MENKIPRFLCLLSYVNVQERGRVGDVGIGGVVWRRRCLCIGLPLLLNENT